MRNVSNLPNHWYARETLLLLQCTCNKHAGIGLPRLPLLLQPRYRFEGDAYPSIRELLEYYRDSQIAVTRRTPAVILNPVSKVKQEGEKWSLRHDDIELGKQLGKGTALLLRCRVPKV